MLTMREAEYRQIRRHGEECYPHESCGVLMGRVQGEDRVVARVARCANTRQDSPGDRYGIDPLDLLRFEREGRERGEDILGFYHSHPDHPARWSATDLAEAYWLGCSYVITSVARGRAQATSSFVLVGSAAEMEKRSFLDEEIRVVSRDL